MEPDLYEAWPKVTQTLYYIATALNDLESLTKFTLVVIIAESASGGHDACELQALCCYGHDKVDVLGLFILVLQSRF